jgi:uncharacterized protein (TIGR02145 family)
MKKTTVIAAVVVVIAAIVSALAVAVVLMGGGGKDAKDKPAAAVATDTVAAAPDTATTFTDTRDGKVYRIVEINGQVWMAENLNYAAEGSKCYKDSAEYCAKYGRLYDWETALTACPAGTHLSTGKEWATLLDYAGGEETAGTTLKSSTGWKSYKDVSTGKDEYGFLALPGGWWDANDDYFRAAGYFGRWWSATAEANNAFFRVMGYFCESVYRGSLGKTSLFSVRCVQNKEGEQ